MSMQERKNNDSRPFILYSGPATKKGKAVIAQIIGRAVPLEPLTLMGKIASSGKFIPLRDLDKADGSSIPAGIYLGPAIPAVDLVAGDIEDCQILETNAHFDQSKLIIENGLTLDSVVEAFSYDGEDTLTSPLDRTLGDYLKDKQLIPVLTDAASDFENN